MQFSSRATFLPYAPTGVTSTTLCYYPSEFHPIPSSRYARVRSFFRHKLLATLRRLAIFLLVVWTVVSLVTLLIELVPGDPAVAVLGEQATPEQFEQFRQKHGLDRPPFFFSFPRDAADMRHFQWHGADNRYTEYWVALLHGDMGRSFRTDRPVKDLIKERYLATIELALAALLIAIIIAIPLGVVAGKNRGSWIDNFASVVALIGISLPGFVIGPLLVYVFAVKLDWLPPSGRFDLSYLIPVVTILGLQLGVLLAGAIITEKIFGWPGLGLLLVEDGIGKRDYRVVQGCVLVISMTYIIANMLTDIVYRWLDPRIRVS